MCEVGSTLLRIQSRTFIFATFVMHVSRRVLREVNLLLQQLTDFDID